MTLRPQPKRRPLRDPKYLSWIRTMSCRATASHDHVEAHHVPQRGQGAVGRKCSDRRAVPLTAEMHREYHAIGRDAFEQRYGVSFEREIIELNRIYDALISQPKVSKPRKVRQITPHIQSVLIRCSCGKPHTIPTSKLVPQKNEYRYWCQTLKGYVLAKFRRSA